MGPGGHHGEASVRPPATAPSPVAKRPGQARLGPAARDLPRGGRSAASPGLPRGPAMRRCGCPGWEPLGSLSIKKKPPPKKKPQKNTGSKTPRMFLPCRGLRIPSCSTSLGGQAGRFGGEFRPLNQSRKIGSEWGGSPAESLRTHKSQNHSGKDLKIIKSIKSL